MKVVCIVIVFMLYFFYFIFTRVTDVYTGAHPGDKTRPVPVVIAH